MGMQTTLPMPGPGQAEASPTTAALFFLLDES